MTVAVRRGWGWPLLAALTVSTIGDELTLLTLMFRTASDRHGFDVPLLLVAELLPGLLVLPYAGRLVDRRDAARLLILVSASQAAVVAAIAAAPSFTIVGAGALSLLFAVSGTATFALIPVLAGGLGVSLVRSNAMLESVRGLGMIAGPAAGGLLVGLTGTRVTLLIDAATFVLLSAILWASGVRRTMPVPDDEAETMARAYAPLLRNRRIAILIGMLSLGVLATAIADVAFVFLVTVSLSAGPIAFGWLTTLWAVGLLGGAAVADRAIAGRPLSRAFLTAGVMGGTMLAIGLSPPSIVVVAIGFVLGGTANGIHNVAVRTLLMIEVAPADHGKIAALYGGATRTATIAGYVAGGAFVPDAARAAYLVAGALGMAAGLGGWRLARRR